ncbi:AraC family transcriptional regulator [Paenibacillus periandrae]|uniref:AraC family transcriptional regulator n=1 Tax=Paenibacillus periandrae TaxID=1761741 RepID=UPI001F099E07|nr:helix-turn-helix domain-containing protein [Paenibacillus periandrae]
MKNKWFYRLLFSYFPIFFSLTSVLIIMTFLLLSELSQRETVNSNQQFVRHIIQLFDHSLQEIDSALIKEIETDERLRAFFHGDNGQSYFDKYEISKKFTQMSTFDSFVDSVYLYRYSDQMVLSMNTFVPLDRFGDREFVESRVAAQTLYTLSNRRSYKEFHDQERFPAAVVSIVRKYPLLQGGEGLIVVNIGLSKVDKLVAEMSGSSSYVVIKDGSGQLISTPSRRNNSPGSQLSQVVSDYTGWQFTGGFYDDHTFRVATVFSYIWVGVGLIVVIAGTIWMTYTTRRNYKPIQEIMNRIQLYSKHRSKLSKKGQDEFKFIEQALDDLIEQSNTYEKMHVEDSVYRRKHFFFELLEGYRLIDNHEWEKELERLKLPASFHSLGVAVYEIDKYYEVSAKYSQRDLYLLKFVLNSVVKEVAESCGVTVWTEWTAQHQLTGLYQSMEETAAAEAQIKEMAERVRAWVQANLDYTVTVGVGGCVEQIADIPVTDSDAIAALAYKASMGLNRVILYQDARVGEGKSYRDLQLIRDFARVFRTGSEDWKLIYEQIFQQTRANRQSREELVQLLNLFIDHLYREMMELSADIQDVWKTDTMMQINRLRDTFDLVEETEVQLASILAAFADQIRDMQQQRSHYTLICQVRAYIDKEYANSDLSLTHLCDLFGLNGKYVSRLFKETFGEKMVDYMMRVRIERSQRLLEETSLSLQQIANQVGYIHDISYIRAFKKLIGTTPGDYRKQYEKSLS